jgi:hypothetical protein
MIYHVNARDTDAGSRTMLTNPTFSRMHCTRLIQTTLSQFRRSVSKVSAEARAKRLVSDIKLC